MKTEYEFGELAQDLNHFLDRISLVVRDLDKILSEVVSVGKRLSGVNRRVEQRLDGLRDLAEDAQQGLASRLAAARQAGAFDVLMRAVEAGGPRLREPLLQLQQRFEAVLQALTPIVNEHF